MKTEDYMHLTPYECEVIDALRKLHEDLVAIEAQLIKLGSGC
jgi:hypothetical protein